MADEHINTDAPADDTSLLGQGAENPAGDADDTTLDDDTSLIGGTAGDKPAGDKPAGAPEAYEAFEMPEGVTLDGKALEQFTPAFRELNLSQDQAQTLVGLYAAQQKAVADAAIADAKATRKAWADEVRTSPTFKDDLGLAQHAVAKFADADTQALIRTSWIGDHPGVMRMLTAIGRSIAEDRGSGKENQGAAPKLTGGQMMYPGMNP